MHQQALTLHAGSSMLPIFAQQQVALAWPDIPLIYPHHSQHPAVASACSGAETCSEAHKGAGQGHAPMPPGSASLCRHLTRLQPCTLGLLPVQDTWLQLHVASCLPHTGPARPVLYDQSIARSRQKPWAAVQGHKLPAGLSATGDIQEMVARCSVILMVVPTPFVERTLRPLAEKLRPDQVCSELSLPAAHSRGGIPWNRHPILIGSYTSNPKQLPASCHVSLKGPPEVESKA